MPAYMHYKDNWLTKQDEHGNYVRNEEYNKLKNEIGEILIARVEKQLAPGLRKHVLFFDVATPVTHHRYTGNKNGTMMGAKPGRSNMQNKIAHYQTPVKNLILSGHWAELGGGVPIAVKAGANASLLILHRNTRRAPSFRLCSVERVGKHEPTNHCCHPERSRRAPAFVSVILTCHPERSAAQSKDPLFRLSRKGGKARTHTIIVLPVGKIGK